MGLIKTMGQDKGMIRGGGGALPALSHGGKEAVRTASGRWFHGQEKRIISAEVYRAWTEDV